MLTASLQIDLEKIFKRFDDTRGPVKDLRNQADALLRNYVLAGEVLEDARRGVSFSSQPTYSARLRVAETEFQRVEAKYNNMIAKIDGELERYRR